MENSKLKVVIMHDWLTGFRGGERILETLCEMYPDAPIYTLLHQKGSTSPTIENREIITSFLDKIPGIYTFYRFYLPLMPIAAMFLRITHKADLVISSSHCVIKGVKKPKGAKHICYLHTPMRYIYDQFDNYFGKSNILIKLVAHLIRPYLRWWDKKSNNNVDYFLPNSKFVQERVQNYYNVGSTVVYPFVDLKDFNKIKNVEIKKENYFIMVTAFAPNKKVDLAIKTFNKLGLNLKIIGSGSQDEVNYLKKIANDNIEFLGRVSREEVISYLSKARAFIFPGVEDFGIAPLEALACGTPVIALKVGGALETLNESVAFYFSEPNESCLSQAIKESQDTTVNKEKLIERAELFSKNNFIKNINQNIDRLVHS